MQELIFIFHHFKVSSKELSVVEDTPHKPPRGESLVGSGELTFFKSPLADREEDEENQLPRFRKPIARIGDGGGHFPYPAIE